MKRTEIIDELKFRAEVTQLPEPYIEVLMLYFLSDLTKKAVAKKLNLSYGITRNRLSKGIYLLKKRSAISFSDNQAESQSAS